MEPDRQTRQAWTAAATAFVEDFVTGLEDAPASAHDAPVPPHLLAPPPDGPGDLADLLARFGDAASRAIETAGPRYFAYFPAGGLYSSALAEFLAQTVNRYTGTGTVDPLAAAGDLARREDMWFHVDGAYGGAFQLTARGREVLTGITGADSIALDPHKSMFLPFGTGVLLVRDQARLRAAHTATGDYLQDLDRDTWPDVADLGPELTRGYRGLRLWLPLHLHGVDAFRRELDEKLDLSAHVHQALSADPNLEVPLTPDLTVSVFRSPHGDAATERLLSRINGTRRVYLSSTRLGGRHTIRLCVLSFRTHKSHVDEVLEIIKRLS